jgi:predicted DCC family thiol-disulfide oxidoreductase YuxK
MKKLAHKIIIYDDVCPMCKAYTEGFVHLGWLPLENRVGFSQVPQTILDQIDSDRARHEIPLFDTETGETIYGKDALFFILGEQMPVLKPLFKFPPFRVLIFVLYQIITYNRRIIAGSPTPQNGFDCAPDFNAFYRWLYIGLATLFSVLLLRNFNQDVGSQWIALLGLFFVGILRGLFFKNFKIKTDYFGHFATVFLIVSFLFNCFSFNPITALLIPLLGIHIWTKRMRLIV